MTTQEHLSLIKAHIEGLLAIAEKRTPGEWLINQTQPTTICDSNRDSTIASTRGLWPVYERAKPDADFIASTAGNFEAALRSTLAAIDLIEYINGFIPALAYLDR